MIGPKQIHQFAGIAMTQDLGYFSPELAAVIGLEEAVIFNKLQWCVENPQMGGTIDGGLKMIRNPIACTNPRKLNKSHGKQVDWLGNFIWASARKLRRIFARLEAIGLVVARKLRSYSFDQCKYYSINYNKLAELLKGAPLSICPKVSNRSDGNDHIDLTAGDKSYQDTYSDLPLQYLERETGAGVKKQEEGGDPDRDLGLHLDKKSEFCTQPEVLGLGKSSATAEFAESDLSNFKTQLEGLGKKLGRRSPIGWAFTIVQNLRAGKTSTYWDEFKAGIPLGASEQREWEIAPGVACSIAIQCLQQDYLSRAGTTPQEAALKAARTIARPKEMAAVWESIKAQVMFRRSEWQRQSELGVQLPVIDSWMVPKAAVSVEEVAIALNEIQSALPEVLKSKSEFSHGQELQALQGQGESALTQTGASVLEPTARIESAIGDENAETTLVTALPDVAVTDYGSKAPIDNEGIATAAKAKISAVLSKFARPNKKWNILEANIAEVKKLVPVSAVAKDVKCDAMVEDEEEIW